MSASIAAQISTRPIRCLVDLHWGDSAAVVLRVAKSAHLRTSDRAVSCAWIRKDSPHLSVLVTRCSAEALFSSANQNSTEPFQLGPSISCVPEAKTTEAHRPSGCFQRKRQ